MHYPTEPQTILSGNLDHFWSKVDKSGDCWIWTGGKDSEGYGRFRPHGHAGPRVQAHRVAYTMLIGPIPDGLVLDHVWERGCRSHACVNPAHLEPVTVEVNSTRAVLARATVALANGTRRQRRVQMLCKHGHPLPPPVDEGKMYPRRRCIPCRDAYRKAQTERERIERTNRAE